MRFFTVMLRHTCRNMLLTWKSQGMTLFTVSLSVLIFSFFYLIYANALHLGAHEVGAHRPGPAAWRPHTTRRRGSPAAPRVQALPEARGFS